MDVVYVCRGGANPELRYSLRSLVHVPHDRVWIFGEPPRWVQNVNVVGIRQSQDKHTNAGGNFRAALNHPQVSDPFWLWNDDMYAMQPTTPEHYHQGPLVDMLERYTSEWPASSYTHSIRASLRRLELVGYHDPLSYELHVPMIVNKSDMVKVDEIGAGVPRFMYRSALGAVGTLGGQQIEDVKVHDGAAKLPVGPWLSSCDGSFTGGLRSRLRELFPEPGWHEGAACRAPGR